MDEYPDRDGLDEMSLSFSVFGFWMNGEEGGILKEGDVKSFGGLRSGGGGGIGGGGGGLGDFGGRRGGGCGGGGG